MLPQNLRIGIDRDDPSVLVNIHPYVSWSVFVYITDKGADKCFDYLSDKIKDREQDYILRYVQKSFALGKYDIVLKWIDRVLCEDNGELRELCAMFFTKLVPKAIDIKNYKTFLIKLFDCKIMEEFKKECEDILIVGCGLYEEVFNYVVKFHPDVLNFSILKLPHIIKSCPIIKRSVLRYRSSIELIYKRYQYDDFCLALAKEDGCKLVKMMQAKCYPFGSVEIDNKWYIPC